MGHSSLRASTKADDTHPRNCLRVGYSISPCECKTTTDYIAQLFIGFGTRTIVAGLQWQPEALLPTVLIMDGSANQDKR